MKDRGCGDNWIMATARANAIRAWYAERHMTVDVVVERVPSTRGTLETDEVWCARITTPIAFDPATSRKAVS